LAVKLVFLRKSGLDEKPGFFYESYYGALHLKIMHIVRDFYKYFATLWLSFGAAHHNICRR
jgi:hypothetical protein